ncbi:hypothetical protein H4219_005123 [Mycoemilia scoparia]|uniref:Uncharacterized protein n=1 Tax=Mycoemilia scoparia TaxID=417184 RepID=A0A9W7ZUX3_9FUNG|nr:hypothetical protein H4219_005123 [Mycoemilia scoparia]
MKISLSFATVASASLLVGLSVASGLPVNQHHEHEHDQDASGSGSVANSNILAGILGPIYNSLTGGGLLQLSGGPVGAGGADQKAQSKADNNGKGNGEVDDHHHQEGKNYDNDAANSGSGGDVDGDSSGSEVDKFAAAYEGIRHNDQIVEYIQTRWRIEREKEVKKLLFREAEKSHDKAAVLFYADHPKDHDNNDDGQGKYDSNGDE